MNVPSIGFFATVRVRVADDTPPAGRTVPGVNVAVTPLGTPEMVKLTGSENPFAAVTVTVRLADWVDFIVRVDGETVSEKSVTRTVSVVV